MLQRVIDDPRMNATDVLVATALICCWHNTKTGGLFPHIETIAARVRKCERTVKSSIAKMRKRGQLLVQRRCGPATFLFKFPPDPRAKSCTSSVQKVAPLNTMKLNPVKTYPQTQSKGRGTEGQRARGSLKLVHGGRE
jgi:hypothetical protein